MSVIKIIIADNQPLTRIGIVTFLQKHFGEMVEFSEVSNKESLIEKAATKQFNILIIDFDLMDFNDVVEMSQIAKIAPEMGILIATDNLFPDTIHKIIDIGITSYVLKNCLEQEFIEAFNATLASKKYFSSNVLDILFEKKSNNKHISDSIKLTLSEIEIVRMIAQGLTTKEIAAQRHLSFHTIITHRKNIFRKLGITNSSELLMYAVRIGILDSSEYYI